MVEKDFQARQEEFLSQLKSKITSQLEEKKFKPEINRISELLTKEERENETWEQKINRHHLPNQNKNEKINMIEKQLYQECTFEPEINEISKALNAQHKKHRCSQEP